MGIINRGSFSSVGTLFVPFVFFFYFFFHLFYLEEFRMKMIILIGLFLSVITVEPKSIQRKKAAGNAEQRARQLDQGSATVEDRYENGEEQVLQKMLRIRQAVQLQAADSVEKIMQAADKAEEPDEAKRESTGKAVENATTTTKTSIQNKYAVTEDAEENKKIIVIEKQSKAADQKSAKEEALTAKTGGLEQLIVKAQSTWRAKAAYGPTVYYTDKVGKYPLKCVWNSGSLEVWANSGKNIEEAEKCCRYLKEIKIYRCIWRVDQKKTFRDAQKYCQQNGMGDLATFRNKPYHDWKVLGYMLPIGARVWIGAHRDKTAYALLPTENGVQKKAYFNNAATWLTGPKHPNPDCTYCPGILALEKDLFEACKCGISADQSQDFELGIFVEKVEKYEWLEPRYNETVNRWWNNLQVANANDNENKFSFVCGDIELPVPGFHI